MMESLCQDVAVVAEKSRLRDGDPGKLRHRMQLATLAHC